jgi:hypothetical protein
MPQGPAPAKAGAARKKIEVQLLLADLPLQFSNPPLRRRCSILGARCHWRLQTRRHEQRVANLLQRVGATRKIFPAPCG